MRALSCQSSHAQARNQMIARKWVQHCQLPNHPQAHQQRRSSTTLHVSARDEPRTGAVKVQRLFSNLNNVTFSHEPGNVAGASLLVAGTAVGAGILALPEATQAAGFAATAPTLFAMCAYSIITGLLIAEVHLSVLATRGAARPVSLLSLAASTLGPAGSTATTATYLFSSYALLVAYITRGSDTLASTLHLSQAAVTPAYVAVLTCLCYATSPAVLDRANSAMVIGVIASFMALVGLALPHVDLPELARASWVDVPAMLPVVALAFVYQNIVPVIVTNLEGDATKVRTAIIAGSSVPLLMFLSWDAAILGSLPGLPEGTTDPLQALQIYNSSVGPLLDLFVLLTVSTSFISFTLALAGFVADLVATTTSRAAPPPTAADAAAPPVTDRTPLVYGITVLPPLAVSVLYPDLFYSALKFAGGLGSMSLYGLVPAAMAWVARNQHRDAARLKSGSGSGGKDLDLGRRSGSGSGSGWAPAYTELVPGGPVMLALVAGTAAVVMVNEVIDKFM